ncbi:MAG: B12-binding domain-containing radical SAM protein [Theionarchaea archaeon]|nr:B12-binding domain-containing radical SAM protein [Theionarchaea archaeon]
MDMIFVFPPIPRTSLSSSLFTYHLGAGYIRSYVQNSVETAQFVTDRKMSTPDIVKGILDYNPLRVGFTCYDANYAYVRILARLVKRTSPDVTIIVGGPTATFSAEEIMEHTPEVDVCVRGEGEETVLELMEKDDLEGIRGITFRSGPRIITTPDRPLITGPKGRELDVLPSPYLTGSIPPDGRAGILTARGCVYHCIYCNFSTMFNHTIRYHSIERVIQELKLLSDNRDPASKDAIMVYDDIFSLDLNRAKKICQKIIDEGIELPLVLETRADNCDKELIELMRDAGVKEINFGLESASCKVLQIIKKAPGKEKQFLKKVKTCVQWAKEAGMTTSVSTIFGLPGEGVKEAEETLNFVKDLNVHKYFHNILSIFPGTEIYRNRREYNMDVYHSPSFLPYMTEYVYDLGKVTPLPHAKLSKTIQKLKKRYYDLFSYGNRNRNTNQYETLILRKMPDNNKFCQWLQEMCSYHLSLVDCSAVTKEEVNCRRKLLLDGGIPVGFYFVVRDGQPKMLHPSPQMSVCTPVEEIPFHQYKKKMDALFTVDTSQDMEVLNEFFTDHIKEGILSFETQEIPQTFASACRWGEHICPALEWDGLVVDGDTVLSCYQGGCIGKVGNTREVLQKTMQEILHEKEEERKCKTCPVTNACSHCLFPPPEFCEMKKKFPGVSVLITVLEWVSVFAGGKEGTVTLLSGGKVPPLFYQPAPSDFPEVRDIIRVIAFNGKAFAFITDEMRSFSLEPAQAAILGALQSGVSKESLVSYLYELTGEDTEKILKSISDTTVIFEKLNFLK